MSSLYQILEKDFSLASGEYGYIKRLVDVCEEGEQTVRFESILLELEIGHLMDLWQEDTKNALRNYCEKRLQESNNIHLKAKYGWALWTLTGKTDYRLLNETVDYTFLCLKSFLDKDDIDHATKFFDYLFKIYTFRGHIGKFRRQTLSELLDSAIRSDNENLRFQIVADIYHQEEDEAKRDESLLPLTNVRLLAETALALAEKETEVIKLQTSLEFAVYFANRTNDSGLIRKANELLGDFKMEHLYPDDEKNLAIAHLNDHLLKDAMTMYKKAGNQTKLAQATLAYQNNQPKLRYLKNGISTTVERRNQEIDLINKQILKVVRGGSLTILNTLFGNGIDVFVSADHLISQSNQSIESVDYKEYFTAVTVDSLHNSRKTTYEKTILHFLSDMVFRNCTSPMYELIIYNGMKEGTLTYELLKEELLNYGFNTVWNKTVNGREIGTSYLERVEIGLKDFMDSLFKSVNGEEVDWRYCTTFLSTQFEGLFRDALKKLGAPVTKVMNNGDTELIPLEGLLNSEKARDVFNNNDLMLFRQTFTKDGYNIRNDIAHGLLLPQEFTASKALLVFLSVIRLTKATRLIIEAAKK